MGMMKVSEATVARVRIEGDGTLDGARVLIGVEQDGEVVWHKLSCVKSIVMDAQIDDGMPRITLCPWGLEGELECVAKLFVSPKDEVGHV